MLGADVNLHPKFEQNHSEAELAQTDMQKKWILKEEEPATCKSKQGEKNPYLRSNNCSISLKSWNSAKIVLSTMSVWGHSDRSQVSLKTKSKTKKSLFLKKKLFISRVWIFYPHVCLWTMCMPGAYWRPEEDVQSLVLELWMAESHSMGAGNPAPALWKSNKCS